MIVRHRKSALATAVWVFAAGTIWAVGCGLSGGDAPLILADASIPDAGSTEFPLGDANSADHRLVDVFADVTADAAADVLADGAKDGAINEGGHPDGSS